MIILLPQGQGFCLWVKLKIQDSLALFFKDISQQSHSSVYPSVPPFDHLFIYLLFKYLLATSYVPGMILDTRVAVEICSHRAYSRKGGQKEPK